MQRLISMGPELLIAPFFWGLKSLITIFYGSIVLNTTESFCRAAALNSFVGGQIAFAYIFLFTWGWMLVGPIPCKSTTPVIVFYSLYVPAHAGYQVYGTILYNIGRYPCAQDTPALARAAYFEVVCFWLAFTAGMLHLIRWGVLRYLRKRKLREASYIAEAADSNIESELPGDRISTVTDDSAASDNNASDPDLGELKQPESDCGLRFVSDLD